MKMRIGSATSAGLKGFSLDSPRNSAECRRATRVRYDPTVALRQPRINRRAFLLSTVALAAVGRSASAQDGTKLILLGTGGGPRPRKASSGSAQVIVRNGAAYVIDLLEV